MRFKCCNAVQVPGQQKPSEIGSVCKFTCLHLLLLTWYPQHSELVSAVSASSSDEVTTFEGCFIVAELGHYTGSCGDATDSFENVSITIPKQWLYCTLADGDIQSRPTFCSEETWTAGMQDNVVTRMRQKQERNAGRRNTGHTYIEKVGNHRSLTKLTI